jgi:hypothetical protein
MYSLGETAGKAIQTSDQNPGLNTYTPDRPMAITLDQIDHQLTEWQNRLDRVNQNLLDLHGLYSYQRLAGVSGIPAVPLSGTTRQQVLPALEDLDNLFQHVGLLADVVHKAASLRQQMPRLLGAEAKLQEIEKLLTSASINLPIVAIPLTERSLLSAAETAQTIEPEALLAIMVNAFDRARTVVLNVDRAWSDLEPRLLKLEQELNPLRGRVETTDLDRHFSQIRQQIDSDPLGADGQFDQTLRPMIDAVKQRVYLEETARDRLHQGIQAAQALMAQIHGLHHQLVIAVAERQEKVTVNVIPAPPQEQLFALKDWLDRLIDRQAAVTAVAVGLDRWMTQGRSLYTQLEGALQANLQPVATRRELRGRLVALQAKALARGWVEDQALVEMAARAKTLLYSRPTPLEEAQDLVSGYERQLNQQSRV